MWNSRGVWTVSDTTIIKKNCFPNQQHPFYFPKYKRSPKIQLIRTIKRKISHWWRTIKTSPNNTYQKKKANKRWANTNYYYVMDLSIPILYPKIVNDYWNCLNQIDTIWPIHKDFISEETTNCIIHHQYAFLLSELPSDTWDFPQIA